jgi:hypothetical protein
MGSEHEIASEQAIREVETATPAVRSPGGLVQLASAVGNQAFGRLLRSPQRQALLRQPNAAPARDRSPSVVVFGQFRRQYPLPNGGTIVADSTEDLKGQAAKTTALRPILINELPGNPATRSNLNRAPNPDEAKRSPYYSGTAMHEALEGGGSQNVQAIYFDLTDSFAPGKDIEKFAQAPGQPAPAKPSLQGSDPAVPYPEGRYHTATEQRSLIANLSAGDHGVDVYVKHSGGMSIVRKGTQTVEGAPLPADWAPHLPPTFRTMPPPAPAPPPTPATPGAAAGAAARGRSGAGAAAADAAEAAPPPKPPAAQAPGRTSSSAAAAQAQANSAAQAKDSQALGGGLLLGAAGVFAAFNHFADKIQAEDAQAALRRERELAAKTMTDSPWLGALVVVVWRRSGAPAFSVNQPGRNFRGAQTIFAETEEAARRELARNNMADRDELMDYETRWVGPSKPGTGPKPRTSTAPPPAEPKSASDVDPALDQEISRKNWPQVAKIINATGRDAASSRVQLDPRITSSRKELMIGALEALVLETGPRHVFDAIWAAEPKAYRDGLIAYLERVTDTGRGGESPRSFPTEWWKRAALTLNLFNDDDLRAWLPRDVEKLKLIREQAMALRLDRIVKAVDDKHAFTP